MRKMIEFQIIKNGELDKTSKSLPSAIENMINSIQEEIVEGCDELITFTSDRCHEVLLDAFRNK